MNKSLWDLYLRLQTDYAYHEGMQLGDAAMPTYNLDPYDRTAWGIQDTPAHCLLIGPGGSGEARFLHALLPEAEITVLSAHHVEIEHLTPHSGVILAIHGDVHDMSLPSDYFDYVFAINVLEHCFAPYIALMECRRVLRDTGAACFLMPSFRGKEGGKGNFHLHCLTEEVWGELLCKVGLDAITTKVIHGDVHPDSFYLQFLCRCVGLREPHSLILERLKGYKEAALPS